MADEPSNPNSTPNGSQRVRNIRADRQLSREMHVQRMTVNTGEEKNAEADMLAEVKDVLTDQTDTLEGVLSNIENISQMQLNAMRGMSKDSGDMTKSLQSYQQSIVQAIERGFAGFSGYAVPTGNAGAGGGSSAADTALNNSHHKELTDSLNNLRQAIVSMGAQEAISGAGGGDGGDGGANGDGVGDAAARANRFRSAADFATAVTGLDAEGRRVETSMAKVSESFVSFNKEGVIQEFRANLINVADTMQRITSKLVDMSNVTQFATDRFAKSVEIASTGAQSFNQVFMDFVPGLRRGADNLTDTFSLLQNSLSSDIISPMGIMGADLYEVSESLRSARLDMLDQGANAMSRLTFQEANEAMVSLFALERRRDVRSDLNDATTRREVMNQLEFASMIATNTGRTADEVVKMNQDRARQLRNLEAGGILQGGERENFEKAIQVFANTPRMGPFAEMLANIARSGGSMELFLSNNPDMATDLAAMNNIPALRGLLDSVKSGGDPNQLMDRAKQFGNNGFTGVAGASVISDGGIELAGAANMARTFGADTEPGTIMSGLRKFQDFFANVIPSAELGMVAALVANTVALGINTAGLMGFRGLGGMLGGAARKGMGGVAAMGKRAGGLMGSAGAAGAGLLGAGGKSLLKKIPLLGLGAGLIFAGQRAFAGDWEGAGMEAASGAASMIPGVGTAASLGLDATLAARDMSTPPTTSRVGAQSTSTATVNQGLRNDTQRLLLDNNRLLETLVALLEEGNDISTDIKQNTAKSIISASPGFFDSMFGRGDDVESHG